MKESDNYKNINEVTAVWSTSQTKRPWDDYL
jgi:hypothetical protein